MLFIVVYHTLDYMRNFLKTRPLKVQLLSFLQISIPLDEHKYNFFLGQVVDSSLLNNLILSSDEFLDEEFFWETWWMRYFLSYKKTTHAIFVSSYTKTLKNKTTKACVCTLSIEIIKSIIVNHEMGHKIDNNEDENASTVARVYQFYKPNSLVQKIKTTCM